VIRRLLPILGITFIDIVGFSMLIPILPYFVTHFGASPLVVGLLASIFSLCGFISGPIWGNLSDRFGRKTVLIISQIGATIGWTMLAFAPNIWIVFLARIIEGTSGGNIGITQAYAADVVRSDERARAFGLIGAMFGAGMIFGPAGAGFLFNLYGFQAPFLAAAALQVVTLLLTVFLLPESHRPVERETAGVDFKQIAKSFAKPHLRPLLLQKMALSLSLYGWYVVIALYLKGQLGFTLVQTTMYFSLFAVLGVIINVFVIGALSKRLGDRGMSTLGLVSLVAAFALVPFVHATPTLIVSMALFSFGMALASTGVTAMISNASTDREQGTILSVASSLDSMAGIVSPPISTGMLAQFGPAYAGVESTLFSAIALLLGTVAGKRERAASSAEIATNSET
jgi:DHA1 family tetracycline resistance protein-like MFS transporter